MEIVVISGKREPWLALAYSGKVIASSFSFSSESLARERLSKSLDMLASRGLELDVVSDRKLKTEAREMMEKIYRALSDELVRLGLLDKLYMGKITRFERKVYYATLDIPFAQTVSYAQLAREIGSSPRAVGQALARNPFPPIIPCHRVIRSDGSLGGFAGSPDASDKARMLELEGRDTYGFPFQTLPSEGT